MNRDECKRLLMVYGGLSELCGLYKDDKELHDAFCAMQENLEYAIVALMTDEKKLVYRDGGITVGGTDWWNGLDLGKVTTVPSCTTRVITRDCMAKEGE